MSKKPAVSHERHIALLKQSLPAVSAEEVADVMFHMLDLETVFSILDAVLTKHQKRLQEIVASETEDGA